MPGKLRVVRAWVGCVLRWLASVGISATLVCLAVSTADAQSTDTKIRIAGQDAQIAATPIFVGLKQGFFKEAGLDVSFVVMGGGALPMAAALKSGELDLSYGGAAQFMQYIAQGAVSGKIVGEMTDNLQSILAREGITDVKQLKGKIFGVASVNSGDEIYSQAVLATFGIKADDVTWLPVGVPETRLATMLAGRIDAMETSVTSLPESAQKRQILGPDESPVKFVSATFFARQGFIVSNKPALQKFMIAIGRADDWIRAHLDDAVTVCKETGSTASTCASSLATLIASKNPYTFSSTGRVNAEGIKGMIPVLAVQFPEMKNKTVDDFVDASIAGGAN